MRNLSCHASHSLRVGAKAAVYEISICCLIWIVNFSKSKYRKLRGKACIGNMHGGLQALPTAQGSSAAEQKQAPQSNLCFALQSCSEHLCAHIIFNAHPKSMEGKRALQRIHCIIKTRSKAGIVQQSLCNKLFRTMSMTKSCKGADV